LFRVEREEGREVEREGGRERGRERGREGTGRPVTANRDVDFGHMEERMPDLVVSLGFGGQIIDEILERDHLRYIAVLGLP
jgi:hypothetical protein